MRLQAWAGALLLSWATAGIAQDKPTDIKAEETKPPTFTFALHGFVSGSMYAQDQNFGPSEGQQSLYINAPASLAARYPNQDRLILGGDIRQSRFNFSVTGPALPAFGNAIPRAMLEIDFFGGFGSGAYGDVSLSPRMRRTTAELDWGGGNKVYFGQDNDLIFTIAPASLAHIAFPYSYGSGNIGWRRPGIWGVHTLGDKKDLNFEFAWEVGRSQWYDAGVIGAAGTNGIGSQFYGSAFSDPFGFQYGESSGLPAVEARAMLAKGTDWSVFTTGHWQRNDRSGVGKPPTTSDTGISSDLDTVAMNVGAKWKWGPLQLAATGFTGKNLGPLIGAFIQFNPNTAGDVHEYGGWVQAGFNITKQLSIWGYAGAEHLNPEEAMAAKFTKLNNVTTTGMLQWRDSIKTASGNSDYAIAFELVHMQTRTRAYTSAEVTAATAAQLSGDVSGNQYLLTGNYFF